MQLNLKLLTIAAGYAPRWDPSLGRAAQVAVTTLQFKVDEDPAPDNWPVDPEVIFAIETSDPAMLEGIDPTNKDQLYTLTLEPAASRKAPAKAKAAPAAKEAPHHGKESGTAHHSR